MSKFTDIELEYLKTQRLGRLATVNKNGEPQIAPVTFRYDADNKQLQKNYGQRVSDGDLTVYQDARRPDKPTGCLSQKCPLDSLPLWRSFW